MTDKLKAQGRAIFAILFAMILVAVNPALAVAEESAAAPVTVTVERSDKFGEDVHVGDVLTFNISFTNNTSSKVSVFPIESNIDGVVPQGNTGGCNYRNLAPGQTGKCSFGTYTVTESDLAGIAFTSIWKITPANDENNPLENAAQLNAATLPAPIAQVNATPRDQLPYTPPALNPQDDAASAGLEVLEIGQKVELARGEYAGFTCHRIPALTVAPNGDILAAWDGRPNGCFDSPNPNSIIQRRSTDGGKTWGKATYIAAGKEAAPKWGYSDPSYVVDREEGKIFAFFVKSFDAGFGTSQPGTNSSSRNVAHTVVTESSDNGISWSEPRIITADINPQGGYSRFAASGEGIQIREGKYQGRLVQQYTFRIGNPGNYTQQAASIYSDDHGKTWKVGTPVGTGMDENKVVELSGGTLMLNSRASDGINARKVAISTNGGESWGEVSVDDQLIDPRNNASIIRAFPFAAADDPKSQVLLFSNARNTARSNGTISVSFDNGKTWPIHKVFEPGGMQYSTLTPLEYKGSEWEGKYGLLYEGNGSTINYQMIDLNWLGLRDDLTYERCYIEDQKAADLTLLTTDLPEQTVANEVRTNMTDGKYGTIWHSKWDTSIELPVMIEFSTTNGPVEAEKLILRHRTDGENGRFKNFTVKGGVGDTLKELGSYTNNPNDGTPTVIQLSEPIEKIQIIVTDTYGNSPNVKFASLAEIELANTGYPSGCSQVIVNGGEITSAINADEVAHTDDKVSVAPIVPAGKKFVEWQTEPSDLALEVGAAGAASFTMPNTPVTLTAVFADIVNPGQQSTSEEPGENDNATSGDNSADNSQPTTPTLTDDDSDTGTSSAKLLSGTGAQLTGIALTAVVLLAAGTALFAIRRREN